MKNDYFERDDENETVFCLPFRDVYDLFTMVDKIKGALQADDSALASLLDEKGVRYSLLDGFGLAVDVTALSKKDLVSVIKRDRTHLNDVLNNLGVIALNVP